MSRDLSDFLAAGWRAITTGELPKAAAVSSAHEAPCALCNGAGELPVDGVFVTCPAPRHKQEAK